MNRLSMTVTCPECGGSLHWLNGSHPSRTESTAVLACCTCRLELLVRVQMVAFARTGPRPKAAVA